MIDTMGDLNTMRELTTKELESVSGGCERCDSASLCPCNYKITHGPQPKPSPGQR